MNCKECGKSLPDGSKFCPECGTKVSEEDTTATNEGGSLGEGVHIGGEGPLVFVGGGVKGRNVVAGDEVHGDKVYGESITVGNIAGSTGIAIGRGEQTIVTQSAQEARDAVQVADIFAEIYERIEARPSDADVDKEEVTETVQRIELELKKGAMSNPNRVERRLHMLSLMAPDIAQLTAEGLGNPLALVPPMVRKVAQKALSR